MNRQRISYIRIRPQGHGHFEPKNEESRRGHFGSFCWIFETDVENDQIGQHSSQHDNQQDLD